MIIQDLLEEEKGWAFYTQKDSVLLGVSEGRKLDAIIVEAKTLANEALELFDFVGPEEGVFGNVSERGRF